MQIPNGAQIEAMLAVLAELAYGADDAARESQANLSKTLLEGGGQWELRINEDAPVLISASTKQV